MKTRTARRSPARRPAAAPAARRHKQFLLTLAAIYPLTLFVPWLLQPLFALESALVPALRHPLLDHLLVAAVVVSLMVWVVMPRATRLLSGWLVR